MNDEMETSQGAAWYVLRTYPGFESKVRRNLENRLRAKNLQLGEYLIIVPVEVDEQAMLSGFVLLRTQIKGNLWFLIRNTPGVTRFVRVGNTPTPFHAEDWKAIPLQRFAI